MSIRAFLKTSATLLGMASLIATTSLGCSADSESTSRQTTGFRVNVQSLNAEQTKQFEIAIETCGGTPVTTAVAPLLPIKLPGGISIEASLLDPNSKHMAGDKYFVLDAGCYRATATPQDGYGNPIDECTVAHSKKLNVEDGRTLETMLISQCKGEARGGLDVISVLNRPPHVKELTFDPSKFVACPDQVKLCVEAIDPDNDPMRAEWSILSGPAPVTAPTVVSSESANGRLLECVAFEPGAGEWSLQVKVWDQLQYNDKLTDFENYYSTIGQPQVSHGFLRFPLYGGGGSCEGPDAGEDTGPDVEQDTGADTGPDAEEDAGDTGDPDTDTRECNCKDSVTLVEYQVDRGGQQLIVADLNQVEQGDKVTAKFTVDAGCDPQEVSLVVYEAQGPDFGSSFPQKLHDFASGSFGPGTHTLGPVSIPDCYFQVDFVCGPVLSDLALNNGERYGDRKIDWHNNGTRSCQPSQGCTRTRGYWSTHHEYAANQALQIDWPSPNGEDEMNLICGKTWLSVIQLQGLGNAWNILAPQYLAALLNIASGASAPPAVADALNEAATLLTGNCAGIPQIDEQRALDIKDVLDDYNNGLIGPGHCP